MSDISVKYSDPFDMILYRISDKLCPYAKTLGMTPNIITTLSNIFFIITIILLIKSYYISAIFTFIISYYFDCMDGNMARKYKMFSEYGELYDHGSDIIKYIVIIITLIYIDYNKFIIALPFALILIFGGLIRRGCYQLYTEINDAPTLLLSTKLCPTKENKELMLKIVKYTRFLGGGTLILYVSLLFLYIKY